MSANTEYGGLCSTCKQASDCTLAGHTSKPVLFCEEFDTGEPCAAKDRGPRPIHAGEDEDSARLLGLCRNCDNRGTCAFPKLEGGIWHCEEYR